MSRLPTAAISRLVVLGAFFSWLCNIGTVRAVIAFTSPSSPRNVVVVRGEGVDDDFFAKVIEGIQLVPEKIWRRIADQHAKPCLPAVTFINGSSLPFECRGNDTCDHSPPQWPAPELVLSLSPDLLAADHGWQLSSRDIPAKWTVVRPNPLFAILNTGEAWVDAVELVLNGTPWNEPPDSIEGTTVFSLPCLGLGKHVFQARYLSGNRWSRLSAPLRLEVRPPPRPVIVALADADCPPVPVSTSGIIPVRSDCITVRLGNVNPNDRVLAYLNGKPVTCDSVGEECCFQVPIRGFVEPGIHSLSVRSVSRDANCGITSEPSASVAMHYFESAAYVVMNGQLSSTPPKDVTTQCHCPKATAEQHGAAPQGTANRRPATVEDKVAESQREFTFLTSAHFPLREFGQRGEVFDREGAVIYEGMTVTIDKNGRLHLSGLVSTPAVPTTLHLRFVLKVCHASRRQLVTVTFPPIEILPSSEGGRDIRGTRELAELTKNLVLPRHSLLGNGQFTIENIDREGTARFGYGFAMTRQQNSP